MGTVHTTYKNGDWGMVYDILLCFITVLPGNLLGIYMDSGELIQGFFSKSRAWTNFAAACGDRARNRCDQRRPPQAPPNITSQRHVTSPGLLPRKNPNVWCEL